MISYLSLGSNQGNKADNLKEALRRLGAVPEILLIKVSGFYETEPWGGVEQDNYLNLAAAIETTLDPLRLLECCQDIENRMGRKRVRHWGPRIIDIDILTYENTKITSEMLIIPHPYMEAREFVLAPLREIAPDLVLSSGKTVLDAKGEGKVKKCLYN
ncbi:MAG: 2-amino-4-hydroxy-6-hydroxymethyldihydropteridine pyrophosphokinase [Candidatus Dichloromethanomonas elyunquensis]|nr:MAG: 2-amino-4-hydroxy-6-hydroxymethyldihydropteridine pyrophosphokinase [Candidatus Dichloromethanomonas elyunquensis]